MRWTGLVPPLLAGSWLALGLGMSVWRAAADLPEDVADVRAVVERGPWERIEAWCGVSREYVRLLADRLGRSGLLVVHTSHADERWLFTYHEKLRNLVFPHPERVRYAWGAEQLRERLADEEERAWILELTAADGPPPPVDRELERIDVTRPRLVPRVLLRLWSTGER